MKRILIFAVGAIALVGCGSNDGSRYINTNDSEFENSQYDETIVEDEDNYECNDEAIEDNQIQDDPTEVKMTKVQCSLCGGTGRCGVCGGGRILYRSGDFIDCDNCNGSGCCQLCEGTGLMDQVAWNYR